MKLIVFGATGKTGLSLVKMALSHGHEVTAFVRNPDKIQLTHEYLNVIVGSPLDLDAVSKAIKGQDAVVSCLGGDGNKKSTILTDMTTTIVNGMKMNEVNRIAYTATAGIFNEIPGVMLNFILSLFLKNVTADHKGAAEYIISNELSYTIARPMGLTDGSLTKEYRKTSEGIPKGGRNISRADVAHFLLDSIEKNHHINEAVGLAY